MTPPSGLPNFIIAGAPRCGTSAAFAYLAAHPGTAGSSVKEVQYFFDRDSVLFHPEANVLDHGLERYRRFFRDGLAARPDARVVMEATPGYLYSRVALEHVPDLPTRPKVLFILRDPPAQLYSSYLYSLGQAANLGPDVSFREFAFGSPRMAASGNEFHRNALAFTRYADFLPGWRDRLGPERMRILTFEDLNRNRARRFAELADWLGLDPAFYDSFGFERVNASVKVKSRLIQRAARIAGRVLPGGARDLAKGLYTRVNLEAAETQPAAPDEVLAEVAAATAEATGRLAEEFGVDVSAWTVRRGEQVMAAV